MKATLGLEWINESCEKRMRLQQKIITIGLGKAVGDQFDMSALSRRPWVARICGRDPKFKLDREFLDSKLSRAHANGPHTRGVYLWFILECGQFYEVKHWRSWRGSERYYCTVTSAGDITRRSAEELEEWLNGHLVLMS